MAAGNGAQAPTGQGMLHCGGCCCRRRVRCRIVNRNQGLCVVIRSKMRLALSRLLPANTRSTTRLYLVENAPVDMDWIVGFFVGPCSLHRGGAFLFANY